MRQQNQWFHAANHAAGGMLNRANWDATNLQNNQWCMGTVNFTATATTNRPCQVGLNGVNICSQNGMAHTVSRESHWSLDRFLRLTSRRLSRGRPDIRARPSSRVGTFTKDCYLFAYHFCSSSLGHFAALVYSSFMYFSSYMLVFN
jgi:hypothetical protein